MHYLTRRDMFFLAGLFSQVFAESQKGGARVKAGEVTLSADLFLSLGGAADNLVEKLLDISFPGTDWNEIPLAAQIELIGVVWEKNDISGILKNSMALIQTAGKSLSPES